MRPVSRCACSPLIRVRPAAGWCSLWRLPTLRWLRTAASTALVRFSGVIRVADIASGHVDDSSAGPAIAAAVNALTAADAGDDDARFAVDGAEGFELQWYASQELADLADIKD